MSTMAPTRTDVRRQKSLAGCVAPLAMVDRACMGVASLLLDWVSLEHHAELTDDADLALGVLQRDWHAQADGEQPARVQPLQADDCPVAELAVFAPAEVQGKLRRRRQRPLEREPKAAVVGVERVERTA